MSFLLCREQYEKVVNNVTLTIHPSAYYVLSGGALKCITVCGHMTR